MTINARFACRALRCAFFAHAVKANESIVAFCSALVTLQEEAFAAFRACRRCAWALVAAFIACLANIGDRCEVAWALFHAWFAIQRFRVFAGCAFHWVIDARVAVGWADVALLVFVVIESWQAACDALSDIVWQQEASQAFRGSALVQEWQFFDTYIMHAKSTTKIILV